MILNNGPLDWAVRALSLFITVELLWLGFTVLLTAERRRWGTWLAGGGLLAGGLLFAVHSVAIEWGLQPSEPNAAPLWRLAWLVFIVAPFLWCLIMAWYTARLHGRADRLMLIALSGLGLALLGVALADVPGLIVIEADYTTGRAAPAPGNLALLVLAPAYSVACMVVAVMLVRRPSASDRFMGDVARRRASSWLIGTSLTLLATAVAAGIGAGWLVGSGAALDGDTLKTVAVLDLVLQTLVAIAVVLLGRAIVSYEIFTGRTLPRRGLFRQWQTSLVVAGGFGLIVGGSLSLPVEPHARLVLASVLLAGTLALLNWRAYIDRDRAIERLRPFVASQHLVDQVLATTPSLTGDEAFRALCEEVLGARLAVLAAVGRMGALVGPPLIYPATSTLDLSRVSSLAGDVTPGHPLCREIAPGCIESVRWVMPLWSGVSVGGLLLLGDKADGTLYTQEEMEVARAASERLLDARAGAELARRLAVLQRRHVVDSQVLDQQTRRVLHDSVLPRLHAALLTMTGTTGAHPAEAATLLAEAHQEIAGVLRALPPPAPTALAQFGLVTALRQVINGELAGAFEAVDWCVDSVAEAALSALTTLDEQIIFGAAREAVRNAARHGRGGAPRALRLWITITLDRCAMIDVVDDGVGYDIAGACQTPSSAGGQGLALHQTMMAIVGGSMTVERLPEGGTRSLIVTPSIGT